MAQHYELIKKVRQRIQTHKYNNENLFVSAHPSAPDPLKLGSDKLPAVFFGYGPARNNELASQGTQTRGETLTILVNVIFEKRKEDAYLMDTSAWMHDRIIDVVESLVRFADDARLQIVTPFSEGLSDREFQQFAIELDTSYYFAQ